MVDRLPNYELGPITITNPCKLVAIRPLNRVMTQLTN